MRQELDGRGGGYGKFAGMTVSEIRELFTKCESDPSMRSVSVVLRVAREQLDARGGLGFYPVYAACALGVFALTFVVKPILPATMAASLPTFQIGCGMVSVALIFGVGVTNRDRKLSLAQEKAIRVAARDSLEHIIAVPGFQAKPLDFTQDLTLKRILKGVTDSPASTLFQGSDS